MYVIYKLQHLYCKCRCGGMCSIDSLLHISAGIVLHMTLNKASTHGSPSRPLLPHSCLGHYSGRYQGCSGLGGSI